MSRYRIKQYTVLFLSLMLLCTPILGSSTTSVDNVINKTYSSLRNIQKQLRAISKSSYVNELNPEANKDYSKELAIYVAQIKQIREELVSLKDIENISSDQDAKLQALFQVATYLDYIQNKISKFLLSNDRAEKYDLLSDIFITNSLVEQIFSYGFSN